MSAVIILATACAVMAAAVLWLPRVRERFAAVKTAVWLLSLVAALSTAGIVVEQRLPPGAYLERYGPALGSFVVRSGLASVFRTWYFLLAVWALSLSILSCSLRRGSALLRSARNRRRGLAMLATHVSIIVVLAGGLLNGVAGFRRPAPDFLGPGDSVEVPEGGFTLRVEEARTEFSDSGALKDYVSVVTVIEDGRELGRHRIEVNSPLVHNGVGVFQFDMLPSADSADEVLLGVVVPRPGDVDLAVEVAAPFGRDVVVPGTDLSIEVVAFLADFRYDIETGTAGSASVRHENPAVLARVREAGRVVGDRWLLGGFGGHRDDQEMPCRLFLLEYTPDYVNGLTRFEFSRQPGTPLMYAGLGVLSLSLCLAFGRRPRTEGSS